MTMTRSNLKGFSSQTYFSHSTGHYNECVTVHNSVPLDPTMTVDAVTQVMDKIKGDKSKALSGGLGMPQPLVDEIFQRRYSTDSDKSRAIASAYVNIHPNPLWKQLNIRLYVTKEFAAAKESTTFMSTGKYCHYITY